MCVCVQIFCIFMMCSAACFFGLVLGELEEIYAAANLKARAAASTDSLGLSNQSNRSSGYPHRFTV